MAAADSEMTLELLQGKKAARSTNAKKLAGNMDTTVSLSGGNDAASTEERKSKLEVSEEQIQLIKAMQDLDFKTFQELLDIKNVKKVNVKYGTHFKAWDASFASVGWTGLYSSIAHNNPVIIHIRSFLNPNGGHYVLLTGMNLYLKQVKIADPSFGGYRILSFSALLTRVNWVVSTGRSSTPLVFLTKT